MAETKSLPLHRKGRKLGVPNLDRKVLLAHAIYMLRRYMTLSEIGKELGMTQENVHYHSSKWEHEYASKA